MRPMVMRQSNPRGLKMGSTALPMLAATEWSVVYSTACTSSRCCSSITFCWEGKFISPQTIMVETRIMRPTLLRNILVDFHMSERTVLPVGRR